MAFSIVVKTWDAGTDVMLELYTEVAAVNLLKVPSAELSLYNGL